MKTGSNYRIIGPKSSTIHRAYVGIPSRRIEHPKALLPPHHPSPPIIAVPELIDISSDEARPRSPVSDTPSQLLEEARKISDPRKLLDDARELAHCLHPSTPVACPGDFLYVWDADAIDNILLALPDNGADPLDDCEYVDRTLNHIFQSVSVSRLVKEMRRGPCGALGIIEGLAFFADKRGLKLEQFEIKILKLLKALRKCLLTPSGPSPGNALSGKSIVPNALHPPQSVALAPHIPSLPKVPQIGSTSGAPHPDMSDDSSSDIEGEADRDWEDEDLDETHPNHADTPNLPRRSYNRGPIPNDLRDSVTALCEAFNNALQELADKSNRPLHQVQRLANLSTVVPLRRSPNPFNGYARKRKIDGLPKREVPKFFYRISNILICYLLGLIVSRAELTDAYLEAKEQFKDNPQALEIWLDELRTVAQTSRVDKDVKLTSGTKVAKFMSRQKKHFKSQMGHMSKFDIHTVLFMVCGCPNAHTAHAQNAIICSSPEIKSLVKTGFNLQKSLNDLFVKVLHRRLDASGLSKWHEDAEKTERANELKRRD